MQKIVPHLWFDKEAVDAAKWYTQLFEDSKIFSISTIAGTPSGDAQTVDFQLAGFRLMAISAGPLFKLNPSVSFMVACGSKEEVNRLYGHLSVGGTELMPLDEYPFSKWFAWIQDQYGVNWQLMLTEPGEGITRIRPTLLFSGAACGKAEEAVDDYVSVFSEAKKGFVNYYAEGEAMDSRAKINYCEFELMGIQFIAMDHGYGADFTFNEAFSLMTVCENQQEIDHYWDKLSVVPEAEQCGWVKDAYGLSWQIVPAMLNEIMANGTKDEVSRVTQAFLKMKKLDIAAIEKARLG